MARSTRRTDGRRVKTFCEGGKQYYVYGHSEKELREKVEEKRKQIRETKFRPGKELTVREYGERWVENRRGTVKSTTIRSHKILINRACKCALDEAGTLFGDLKLVEVEPDHVRMLQRQLDLGGYQTSTVNSTINEIRSLFKDAVVDRILIYNPALGIKPLRRREEEARDTIHRALTEDEVKRFFEEAEGTWYCNLFRVMLGTGMRCGEASALMYEDVKDGIINVKRTLTRGEDGKTVVGESAKTKAGERVIPLTEVVREALDSQKRYNIEFQGADVFSNEHLFFRNARGGMADSSHVDQAIKRICETAGIEKFTAHAFRDTFATRAVESQMNPKTLQEILGHSDINMTMNLYAHVMDDTKIEEMARVSMAM